MKAIVPNLAALLCLAWAMPVSATTYTPVILYELAPPPGEAMSFFGSGGITHGQVVGSGVTGGTINNYHALLWDRGTGIASDMNPAGFLQSVMEFTDGSHQVGQAGTSPQGNDQHAAMWSGTAQSAVDLQPAGFGSSDAHGVGGGEEVGFGFLGDYTSTPYHALLWHGTAASAVDLHPSKLRGFTSSNAFGTDGTEQVGFGTGSGTGAYNHALLWNGTAASVVDLNPTKLSGFNQSMADGVGHGQQVGYGGAGGNIYYALLWTGTASSAVNLNPAGFLDSAAYFTNGTDQVGFARDGKLIDHAMLWSGSAQSAVDLGALLPPNLANSRAYNIDDAGIIYGLANGTPVAWVPHPVPVGDVNLDGHVGFDDFVILAAHYGQPGSRLSGDFNGNGTVDFSDLVTLVVHYGEGTSPEGVASVPEPCATAMATFSILGFVVGSRLARRAGGLRGGWTATSGGYCATP